MDKDYDEIIDSIEKNDILIESMNNIITKKLVEDIVWKNSCNDIDHLELTLALARRQLYVNQLYGSNKGKTKEKPNNNTKALSLVNERNEFIEKQLATSRYCATCEQSTLIKHYNEIAFLKKLYNVISKD